MKISVIVVTYNSASYIARCLDSVLAQKRDGLEVIVVDNGSVDATAPLVRERYPQVKLIQNERNEGASRARNQAIEASSGEWLLALDADAFLKPDFLSSLSRFLEKAEDGDRLGMVAGVILYPDNETVYAIGHQMTFLRRFTDIQRGAKLRRARLENARVFGPCSATAVYRRRMLEELKKADGFYFDPDFFFMAEDVDLAWRARRRGWRVRLCPSCVSLHAGNSAGLDASQKKYYSMRNRFLLICNNDTARSLLALSVPLVGYELARFLFLSLKGEGGVYLRALRSALALIRTKNRSRH